MKEGLDVRGLNANKSYLRLVAFVEGNPNPVKSFQLYWDKRSSGFTLQSRNWVTKSQKVTQFHF